MMRFACLIDLPAFFPIISNRLKFGFLNFSRVRVVSLFKFASGRNLLCIDRKRACGGKCKITAALGALVVILHLEANFGKRLE